MTTDFKNIQFKFIKLDGTTPSIDTSMTEDKFLANKPDGYYWCFTFKSKFSGNDYEDLRNLISIESTDKMWDETNRDTFLGFIEDTKEFIVNMNAYLGLKDPDLKTDGAINHPGQAAWTAMSLSSSSKSSSIGKLKDVNGSFIYMDPAASYIGTDSNGLSFARPTSVAVDFTPKTVINTPLVVKNNDEQLWTKSSEDGSAIMVNNYVKEIASGTRNNKATSKLANNNKEYGFDKAPNFYYMSTYKYGKKAMSFSSTSSINAINNYYLPVYIQNKTQDTDIDLTSTDDLNDILSSGESLVFSMLPKARMFDFVGVKDSNQPYNTYENSVSFAQPPMFFNSEDWTSNGEYFTENVTQGSGTDYIGISCDLISSDSRKPFVYAPSTKNIICYGIDAKSKYWKINPQDFIRDIPDGFVFLVTCKNKIFRYKKGENVKSKNIASVERLTTYTNITGSTSFGNDLYIEDRQRKYGSVGISKADSISGTGFSEELGTEDLSRYYVSTILVTVLKI